MKRHEVKCTNPSFTEMWNGEKPVDIRKDDRNYLKGELLWQREYKLGPGTGYTGRDMVQFISYKLPAGIYPGLISGYCAMGVITLQKREAGSTVPLLDVITHGP